MAELTGKYMLPVLIFKKSNFISKECRICGKDILYKKQYYYTSPLFGTKLTVCRDCGVREYYGTKGKSTKKYKKDIVDKKVFGIDDND